MGWQKYFVITFSAIWVLVASLTVFIHMLALRLPSFTELKETSQGLTYLDRSGQPLVSQKREASPSKYNWVDLSSIDPHLVQAISEQPGLSVHVVRLLDGMDPLKSHRTWIQRGKAHVLARALRHRWTSAEIVEAYLNLAYFRRDIQGLSSATLEIFEKSPRSLNQKEIQTLVSLLRAPLGRRTVSRRHPGLVVPSFFEERARTQGYVVGNIPLTLDVAVNRDVQNAIHHYGARKTAAVVVMENASGDVLSTVGDVDKTHLARSILNPWLYGMALDRGVVSMSSWLHDAPLSMVQDRTFRETVSVREALENSLSIPSVQVLELLGVDQYLDLLKTLELKNVPTAALAGPSLVIDGPMVSLLEVANAYRTFASHGVYSPPKWRRTTLPQRTQRILGAGASYIIEESLGRHGLIPTAPLWTGLKHVSQAEGEWCVGFSDTYTIGIWMPPRTGFQEIASVWVEILRHLHKSRPSIAPVPPKDVWLEISGGFSNNQLSFASVPPSDVSNREVKANPKKSVTEYYLAGTEFLRRREVGMAQKSRIVFPLDQSDLTLEQRRSPAAALQKIFFQAHPANAKDFWVLNGRRIGSVREFTAWSPEVGRFELEIRDAQGHTVDSVRFKVRAQQESWPITQKTTISEKPKRGAL